MAKSVFTFIPAFGNTVTSTTFMTICQLQQALASKNINMSLSCLSFPDIAELRSMAMTIWYDCMPQVDYLLFVDADMGFQADIVLDMLLLDEPVMGTIYPQRKTPISWAGSGTGDGVTERRGNFMKVEGVGMGCTVIRREVVTAMLARFPEIVDKRLDLHPAGKIVKSAGTNRIIRAFEKLDIPDRGLVSEDLSFCIRWNQCGGTVWAAIGYPISHVGMFDYQGCYLQHVQQQQAQIEAREAMQKQLAAQFEPQPDSDNGQSAPFVFTQASAPIPEPAVVTAAEQRVEAGSVETSIERVERKPRRARLEHKKKRHR